MRKFIIKVLAVGMVLSMSGCGSREIVSETGGSSVAVQEDTTGVRICGHFRLWLRR